jgi:exoribonuclease II
LPPSPRAIGVGDLVGLNDAKGPQLALVLQLRGTRADLVVGYEGRAQQVPLRLLDRLAAAGASDVQRLHQAPWCLESVTVAAALPSLRDLAAAWLLLQPDSPGATPIPTELPAFVELVCGEIVPARLAACWLWLQGRQTLFRWRQGQVEPRSLAEVQRLRRERRQLQLIEQRRQQWHGALRQRRPLAVESLEADQLQDLELLRRWVCGDTQEPLPPELRRALQGCHCAPDAAAIRHLLVDLGQWSRHHLPSLEASIWQSGFSPALQQETERLLALAASPCPGDERRQDLTALHTVTIDDEDTLDIDDGVALEWLADGRERLWIHIADPGRLVMPDSPLDLEARRRASSLYLAQGSLPMFPLELANGAFSLRQGQRCAAWSLAVDLDADGAVASYHLSRSWVKPTYKLSYGDADELIELAPPQEQLRAIHALMERRRQWRLRQGALVLDQAEGRIRCRPNSATLPNEPGDPIASLEITEPSPSRLMVAEAMILAGAVVAAHGLEHGLALPYRSQQSAVLPPEAELQALPPGPVRHAALKRCLSRGHMGCTAAPHFSLGLAAYVQATSPIRRYADLLVQRQLQALQDDVPPLDQPAVSALLLALESPLRQGIQISRDDQRHWQQVWFEHHPQTQWRAQFLRWLRPQDHLALVYLEDLAMELPAECPPRSQPGDAVLIRVQQVDSLADQLRLQASA